MIEKALWQMYDSMLWVGFSTAKLWDEFGADFSEYFDSEEKNIRAGSALAFFGMLECWYQGSCNAFYKSDSYDGINDFDVYLERFLDQSERIKKEFPNIYVAIVSTLIDLDTVKKFEETFPEYSEVLFSKAREKLFTKDFVELDPQSYKEALSEAGLGSDYM